MQMHSYIPYLRLLFTFMHPKYSFEMDQFYDYFIFSTNQITQFHISHTSQKNTQNIISLNG